MTHPTMKRIPWNMIRQAITRIPLIVAERAFFLTLFLIAIAGAFALLIFYAYGFSAQIKHVDQGTSLYDAKEELFLDTVTVLEERAQNLENAGKETTRDIFNPTELTGE